MNFPARAREALSAWKRDRAKMVAFDTETTGVEFHDEPFCVTVAWRGIAGQLESHYLELAEPEGLDAALEILNEAPQLVGHNLKFDLQKACLVGLMERESLSHLRLHDTEAMSHLLDEHRRKGLKFLARVLLAEETDEDTAIKEAKKVVKKREGLRSEKEIGYHMLPREVVVPYALKDAEFTLRLFELLHPQLCRHPDLVDLYAMERELMLVLLDMETAGFAVDMEYAQRVSGEYGRKIMDAEQRIAAITGMEIGPKPDKDQFNPGSPKQVTEWFAEEAGIILLSTDKPSLRNVKHPLAEALLDLRQVTKMHGTYLVPLRKETRDGIIHPNFRQHGTKTGRMSSGGAAA